MKGWNGENLWAGHGHFTDDFDPTVGMTSWYNEYKDYDFYSHNCTPKKLCGHYTQVRRFSLNGVAKIIIPLFIFPTSYHQLPVTIQKQFSKNY